MGPSVRDQNGQPQIHTPYTCEYQVARGAADASNPAVALGLPKIAPPNFIFRVSGSNVRQADSVTIAVTLTPAGLRAEAKNFLLESIQLLFQTMGQSLPRGLSPSIAREQRILIHEPYAAISFLPLNGPTRKEHVLWFQMRRKISR